MFDLKAAAVAANRFGFGAKPGELDAIAPDPRGWLRQQLRAPSPVSVAMQSPARLGLYFQLRQARKTDADAAQQFQAEFRQRFQAESGLRTLAAASSAAPFLERLVQFWSNHFTVSVQRPVVVPVALGFENEAIRPHVLGRFRDMLGAVARHPAMLLYLDNAVSIGPNSQVGRNRDKGLNENLGREMMELHTLGVDGGYTQTDVTELAKILTGWSVARETEPDSGAFRYRPGVHEPGPKTLLGRNYKEAGIEEGEAALDDLASRPQTARHIATQLVRHFVADSPPSACIETLAAVFQKSGGDLSAVSLALIDLPQIWSSPLSKIKTPNDLVVSAYRVFGVVDEKSADAAFGSLRLMGQAPFSAPSPAGWADTADAWISPESMLTRVRWAFAAGAKLVGKADPRTAAQGSIAPIASTATLFHIDNAPSPAEGLALLIASPEFQRR
jgi:uncharacterized protein (DUF1800 family)